MLSLKNIFLKFGDRVLFDYVGLTVADRDRAGLIGRNGAGKSTLLKIIAGVQAPDDGIVEFPSGRSIGYLHQEMNLPKGKTVMDEALTCFDDLKQMDARIHQLQVELAERTDYESPAYAKILSETEELTQLFALRGGQSMAGDAERVLKGLGFRHSDFGRLTDEFSGGWQMRIELGKLLLRKPEYLLLDEPTNHLDIESIIWLEGFLESYPGVVIVISHDKQFLDNVTNRTVEIELGKIFDYKAPFSKAVEMRAERRRKLLAAFENQQRVIAEKERTINRFMAKATKTSMAQSMQKQLDKMDRIELDDEDTAVMNIRFPDAPRSGQVVVKLDNLSKHYGNLEVLSKIDLQIEREERVAFVGQNGQGKTTLAKIIVNEIPASVGVMALGHNVQIGYYAQNQSDTLRPNLTVLETLESDCPADMRTKVRAILGAFLFSGEDTDKKVSVLSGGERARLALACMMLRPFNLLVLDEPTNHLDMLSKDVLKNALLNFNGTLIVVSHDREFLGGLTSKTIEFRDHQLFEHLGDVNYFLQRRALRDMREVELQKPRNTAPTPVAQSSTPKDWQERKRLQRLVQNIENKIEDLENALSLSEKKLADPAFFGKPESGEVLKNYQKQKEKLEAVMLEWEEAQLALEAFDN
jgi:ATP-binding cassette subfamily F protein 3